MISNAMPNATAVILGLAPRIQGLWTGCMRRAQWTWRTSAFQNPGSRIARLRRLSGMTIGAIAALILTASVASATDIPMDTIVLGGLDKVAARVNTFSGKVGAPITFGTLEIRADTCVTHPPEDTPENAAFLEIFQLLDGGKKEKVFSGWMFGSSPALSALDHPVYDVWVMRCENSKASKPR